MPAVSIVVIKFSSDEDTKGTKTRVAIDENASLKTLRSILGTDGIMKSVDIFEDSDEIGISKSSEESTKWSEIAKEKQIRVRAKGSAAPRENIPLPGRIETPGDHTDAKATLTGGTFAKGDYSERKAAIFGTGVTETVDRRNVNDLSPEEVNTLVANASLGWGINPTREAADCYINPVVKAVSPDDIVRTAINRSKQSTAISMTSREASYAEAGWMEANITAETPWISGSVSGGFQKSSNTSSSSSTIHITGRWAYTKCRLSLPMEGLEPQHGLKVAIEKALARQTPEEQRKALINVFQNYGYYFISAVEMGGVKFTTSETTTNEKTTQSDFKMHMDIAVSKRFGPADVGAKVGGGTSSSSATSEKSMFESNNFATHGGDIQLDDIDKWKQSLSDFHTWMPVRPCQIRPAIELFDDATQAKVIALVPAAAAPVVETFGKEESIPLHRLLQSNPFNHFYCIDDSERDSAIRGGYTYEGVMGRVLRQSKYGAIPLYRHFGGHDHFYTANPEEHTKVVAGGWYRDEGNAGHLFAMQVKDTIPLYRAFQPSSGDHFYTINESELNSALNIGYKGEGIVGYVFPA